MLFFILKISVLFFILKKISVICYFWKYQCYFLFWKYQCFFILKISVLFCLFQFHLNFTKIVTSPWYLTFDSISDISTTIVLDLSDYILYFPDSIIEFPDLIIDFADLDAHFGLDTRMFWFKPWLCLPGTQLFRLGTRDFWIDTRYTTIAIARLL